LRSTCSSRKVRSECEGARFSCWASSTIDADLTENANGWVLKWFSEEKWTFDTAGKLTSMKDKNNNDITLTYNADDTLQQITDMQDRTTRFFYSGSGTSKRIDSVIDDAGNRTFDYTTSSGLLTSYVDPENGSTKPTTYSYSSGLLTTITDPRGHDTVITYQNNRVQTIKRVLNPSTQTGLTTTFTYFDTDTCTGTADVVGMNRPGFIGGSVLWVHQRSSGRVRVDMPPRTRQAARNRSARAVVGG
jgi:YD repeat-containing protein